MSLTDVMSAMGLAVFPQIAMVIFLVVFLGVMVWTFHPAHRERHQRANQLPLDDRDPAEPSEGDARE